MTTRWERIIGLSVAYIMVKTVAGIIFYRYFKKYVNKEEVVIFIFTTSPFFNFLALYFDDWYWDWTIAHDENFGKTVDAIQVRSAYLFSVVG